MAVSQISQTTWPKPNSPTLLLFSLLHNSKWHRHSFSCSRQILESLLMPLFFSHLAFNLSTNLISLSSKYSVQSLIHIRLLATPWTVAHQASWSIANSWSLLKLMSIESVMPSNHIILCHPLLLLLSIHPSIRVFSKWVSSSHQVAKVLEFQLQHQSFQWIFRIDFL